MGEALNFQEDKPENSQPRTDEDVEDQVVESDSVEEEEYLNENDFTPEGNSKFPLYFVL